MMAGGRRKTSRRDALVVLGGLAAVAAGWQVWLRRPRHFAFEPVEGAPGWRRATTTETSGGGGATSAVFVGLDGGGPAVPPLPAADLEPVLFPKGEDFAVLTDVLCPYCRRIIPVLAAMEDVRIAWHALPLFGRISELAAKAAVAADMQGDGGDMHVRLHALPLRPSPGFFASLAAEAGLDGDRLLRDMDSAEVAQRLQQSRAAASRLGIFGTPAFAIPGTVVIGAMRPGEIQRMRERSL